MKRVPRFPAAGYLFLILLPVSQGSRETGKIAFLSNRTGTPRIFLMNLDGTGQRPLTDLAGEEDGPSWSPVGSRIAFQTFRDGNFERP